MPSALPSLLCSDCCRTGGLQGRTFPYLFLCSPSFSSSTGYINSHTRGFIKLNYSDVTAASECSVFPTLVVLEDGEGTTVTNRSHHFLFILNIYKMLGFFN